jgi:hypothetical protein
MSVIDSEIHRNAGKLKKYDLYSSDSCLRNLGEFLENFCDFWGNFGEFFKNSNEIFRIPQEISINSWKA